MHAFLLNLFLAMAYTALTGEIGLFNLIVGFVIGYGLLALYSLTGGCSNYPKMVVRLIKFTGHFLVIMVKANLQVAWEIITPKFRMTPRIIRYPVQNLTATQITTLANAITLTPGTLTADIDSSGEFLYIHCMYAKDRNQAVREIDQLKSGLMKQVFGL